LSQPKRKVARKREKSVPQKGKDRKLNHTTHQLGEELQRKVREENTQSNDWEFGKSKRESGNMRS